MRLRKQKKVVAVTLATAIAVSTISASASAVTYDLSDGDVTVDQDTNGAFSYQEGNEKHTYVNEDTEDGGKIIVTQGNKDESTSNTVTVKEDVQKTENGRDVDIVVDGVNVDTSRDADTSGAAKDDRTAITVGEGADVNLTVKDSTLTTGGNGIDIGKNLDDEDENKGTKVDLTLQGSTIKLTEKDNTVGVDIRDGSDVDLSLKGTTTIDGKEALTAAKKEAEAAKPNPSPNLNVEGIRTGGEGTGDSSAGRGGASLTIKGDKTGEGGSLNIDHTFTGMVISDGSNVTLTDSADVDIKNTEAGPSTQGGRGIVQRGDLTLEDKSSLTIDTVGSGAYKIDTGDGGMDYYNYGYGIDSTAAITVKDGSQLAIKGTQASAIYGGTDASLTVKDSTLTIKNKTLGVDYESNAGDITFKDSKVDISSDGMGIAINKNGSSNVTFDHSTGSISSSRKWKDGTAIYAEGGGNGDLTFRNDSDITLNAYFGIQAGFKNVEISGQSKVTSNGSTGMLFHGGDSGSTQLHVTGNSVYDLNMTGVEDPRDPQGPLFVDDALRLDVSPGCSILVDKNGTLRIAQATAGGDSSAITMGDHATLTVANGTLVTEGNFDYGILSYEDKEEPPITTTTTIMNGSHVDVHSIVGTGRDAEKKLIVTGGTLTYDYSADDTLWPVNAKGDRLTNFRLTKDAGHADFRAFSYNNGPRYRYVSDLNKETDKSYLSVWVPAAALEYKLDVDGSHDPEIIGKALEDLKNAGYNFDTPYKTTTNGDEVIVLQDLVANGHSLNFTKITDAEGNTKLFWGSYDKRTDGKPHAYDMVYGTEYENEGQKYTIVWGYESQYNPNTSAKAGVLDGFDADSNVLVNGEGTVVTIYGALREVKPPVVDPDPDPTPDPTPVTPDQPDTPEKTPAAQETPAAQKTVSTPTTSALPKTGVNWMAALAMALSGFALTIAGAWASLLGKNSRH